MSIYTSKKKSFDEEPNSSSNKRLILMQSYPLIGTQISSRASCAMCNMLNQPGVVTQQALNLSYPRPPDSITPRTLQMNYERILFRELDVNDIMTYLYRHKFIGESYPKSNSNDVKDYTHLDENGCTYLASPTNKNTENMPADYASRTLVNKETKSHYHYELVGTESEYPSFDKQCPAYFLFRIFLKDIDNEDDYTIQPHYMAVRMFENVWEKRNNNKRQKIMEKELDETDDGVGLEIAATLFAKHAPGPLGSPHRNMNEYVRGHLSFDNASQEIKDGKLTENETIKDNIHTVEQYQGRNFQYYILPGDGVVPITEVMSAKHTFFTSQGRENLLNHFQQFYSAHGIICTFDRHEVQQSCMFVPSEILSGRESESQWNLMTKKDIEAYHHPMVVTRDHRIPSINERIGSIQALNLHVSNPKNKELFARL